MKNKIIGVELVTIVLLSLIPWPTTHTPRTPCPRDKSTLVRRFLQKRVYPILERYGVNLPLECPLQATRDIYWPHEQRKSRPRSSQWVCGFCGKAFFTERHLDLHFTHRHPEFTSTAEDGVCLANFCDIMRCDVLEAKGDWWDNNHVTDVDVWRDSKTALEKSNNRDLLRLKPARKSKLLEKIKAKQKDEKNESVDGMPSNDSAANSSGSSSSASNSKRTEECDSRGGGGKACIGYVINEPQQPPLPHNCDPKKLEKLKTKCEVFLAECIAGLVLNLSKKEYLQLEEEMLLAVCWYLRCERYWESTSALVRSLPWGLLFALLLALTLVTTLVYYLLWLVTEIGKLLYKRYQSIPSNIHHSNIHPTVTVEESFTPRREGRMGRVPEEEEEDTMWRNTSMHHNTQWTMDTRTRSSWSPTRQSSSRGSSRLEPHSQQGYY